MRGDFTNPMPYMNNIYRRAPGLRSQSIEFKRSKLQCFLGSLEINGEHNIKKRPYQNIMGHTNWKQSSKTASKTREQR